MVTATAFRLSSRSAVGLAVPCDLGLCEWRGLLGSPEGVSCREIRPLWRPFRRHDDAGRQIADPERRGDQIIYEHENIQRVKKVEVYALIIEKIKGKILETIAI